MKKRRKISTSRIGENLLQWILHGKFFTNIQRMILSIGHWMDKISSSLTSNKKQQYIFSLVCAMLLSVSCYFIENQPYEFSDKSLLFYCFESPFWQWSYEFDENVKFINVSHDRQLVYIDESDTTLGNTDITDRGKLLRFFEKIESDNIQYKGIMVDLEFEKMLKTDFDSALYHKMASMRNVVVAHQASEPDSEYEIADSVLLAIAGFADYKQVAYENDFFRYQFLQNQGPSLALKLHDLIHAKETSIKKLPWFPVYWSKKHLCTNCPLLPIHGDVYDKWSSPQKKDNVNNFDKHYNFFEDLGADWLQWEDRNWQMEFKDAYIVIGDFENDIHDTYAGPRSGAYINWLAYMYLDKEIHMLNWLYVSLMFVFYALMIYMMFFLSNYARKTENKTNKSLLFLIAVLRWLGTIGLLYLMSFLFYKIFKVRYNVTIPIFFIAIVNFIIQNTNEYEKNTTSYYKLPADC